MAETSGIEEKRRRVGERRSDGEGRIEEVAKTEEERIVEEIERKTLQRIEDDEAEERNESTR